VVKTRVALTYDWLTNMGGAERLMLALHEVYPDAPLYTSVYEPSKMPLFKDIDIRTSWLQKLPTFLRRRHQLFPVLRAQAFRNFDLQDYDVIISSTSAEAKAVRKRPDAVHICYCHTPTRYYWSHYEEYKQNPGFGVLDPIIKLIIPPFVWWMRKLDLRAVRGVDYFIANSHEVQARIKKYYKRDATVIYPPIDTKRLKAKKPVQKGDYYLMVGRQIPYKRFDLAIKACNQLGVKLLVIGRGSEHDKLVALAGPTVEFKTVDSDQDIVEYFQRAKGFIWPQFEDFGMTAVEAMAAGTPVIAFKKGGALDYMVDGKTGLFFNEQTVKSLVGALKKFETMQFDSNVISAHAEQFSIDVFKKKIREFVADHSK
jgi:glycosyltransferase involved in cell wall biosynthesis